MALTGPAATLGQAKVPIKTNQKVKKITTKIEKMAKAEKNGILYMMKPRHPY
jgi:transcription initiation factor IIE alpha subunit